MYLIDTRKCIKIIHLVKYTKTPSITITLNAEKAFNRVDLECMPPSSSKIWIQPYVSIYILDNYISSKARILINGYRKDFLHLQRGTRQRCPLPPFIFALVMEPLSQKIRDNLEIQSLMLGNVTYTLSIFADGVLAILSHPITSVPVLTEKPY